MVQAHPGYSHCRWEPLQKDVGGYLLPAMYCRHSTEVLIIVHCRQSCKSPNISAVVPPRLILCTASLQIGCLELTCFVCLPFCFWEHILNCYLAWMLQRQLLEQFPKLVCHC